MAPEVGSIKRLMQRSKVDLPVPDGPMMLVSPVLGIHRSIDLSTAWPGHVVAPQPLMDKSR